MATKDKVQAVLDSIVALKADSGFSGNLIADADKLKADCEAWLAAAIGGASSGGTTATPAIRPTAAQLGVPKVRYVEMKFPMTLDVNGDGRISSKEMTPNGLITQDEVVIAVVKMLSTPCNFRVGFNHSGGAVGPSRAREFMISTYPLDKSRAMPGSILEGANAAPIYSPKLSIGHPVPAGSTGRFNLQPETEYFISMKTVHEDGNEAADVFVSFDNPIIG